MTFEEILAQDGLYKSGSFKEGVCFEVKNGILSQVTYMDANDILPVKNLPIVTLSIVKKEYSEVLTRQSLFA